MSNPHYFKTISILFKKELMAYFNSPIAYIFIGIFLIVGNWLFMNPFFINNQVSMRTYFITLPWIFLFLAPAITMRLWAEEKRSGTIEFLLTLPITNWQLVLSKFLGAFVFLAVSLVLSLSIPITIFYLGDLDLGPVIGGYLGALFLGGAYLAIGMFVSSMTKNQIIAFITGLVVCFIFFVIGAEFVLNYTSGLLSDVLKFLGMGNRFSSIARGVLDSKDLIFYGTFVFLFLWLNVKVLEKRK
ncbi:MAG: ABC transporter permease subunit [bacterium]